MEAFGANREPVCGILGSILGQDDIDGTILVCLQTGAVIDTVAVNGIIDQEIIISVGGDRPEASLKHLRTGFKMERVGLFAGQGISVRIHFQLGI